MKVVLFGTTKQQACYFLNINFLMRIVSPLILISTASSFSLCWANSSSGCSLVCFKTSKVASDGMTAKSDTFETDVIFEKIESFRNFSEKADSSFSSMCPTQSMFSNEVQTASEYLVTEELSEYSGGLNSESTLNSGQEDTMGTSEDDFKKTATSENGSKINLNEEEKESKSKYTEGESAGLILYDKIISYIHSDNSDKKQKLENLKAAHLKQAVEIIEGALRVYSPEGLFCAFNGGKDATVLLHLYNSVLEHYRETNGTKDKLKAVYFHDCESEIPEVLSFIRKMEVLYDMDLLVVPGSYAEGLKDVFKFAFPSSVENNTKWNKHLGFLMGVRSTDKSKVKIFPFEPSSSWLDVPSSFMRIHPLFDWSYGMVWDFLDYFELTYCELYDKGFTSLGKVNETSVNPHLVQSDGSILSARHLQDWSTERAQRIKSPPAVKSAPPLI